jgi:hypothetical protein
MIVSWLMLTGTAMPILVFYAVLIAALLHAS